jgi:putative NADPH-quinone reductase
VLRDLYRERFDPLVGAAEARGEPCDDPLVCAHIALLRASLALVVVHPNWWGAPPAIAKGWIDRVFALNAAYAFEKDVDQGDVAIGLLPIRAALVLNTSNTTAQRERDVFGDPLARIWQDCVLRYCGVRHVERRVFRVVATSTAAERDGWLAEARTAVAAMLSGASTDD